MRGVAWPDNALLINPASKGVLDIRERHPAGLAGGFRRFLAKTQPTAAPMPAAASDQHDEGRFGFCRESAGRPEPRRAKLQRLAASAPLHLHDLVGLGAAGGDHLDVTRDAAGHVAFGHGVHHCLGAPLARMEMRTAFPALLRRFPELALAVPFDEVGFRAFHFIYGLRTLPVRW